MAVCGRLRWSRHSDVCEIAGCKDGASVRRLQAQKGGASAVQLPDSPDTDVAEVCWKPKWSRYYVVVWEKR